MARTNTLKNYLTDVATAIKNKKGDTTSIKASDFDTEISNLPTGVDIEDYFSTTYNYNGTTTNTLQKYYIKKMPDVTLSSPYVGGYLFYSWSLSDIPKILNTNIMTTLQFMFYSSTLTELDLTDWDTSNATNMQSVFMYCQRLTSIDISGWDTSKVTTFQNCFYNETVLKELDISSWDASSCVNVYNMLNASSTSYAKLENLSFMKNLGKGYLTSMATNTVNYKLDVSKHSNLTHDSLMSIINNLYDIATKGCNAQQLVLGSTNLAKLTDDEVAIATNKRLDSIIKGGIKNAIF